MALSLRYIDSVIILSISCATALICEAISWILIYRTNSYKSLRSTIDKASRKLELMKGTGSSAVSSSSSSSSSLSSSSSFSSVSKSSKGKKMDRLETSLKESNRDLSFSKFKSGGVVAIVLLVVFGLLNSLFEGKVVAKLPFAPLPFIQRMSHRGLGGDDPTDCAMVFLYFLCSVSIKPSETARVCSAPKRR